MSGTGFGQRLDALVARHVKTQVPAPDGLPWYAAPLPEWLENVGLRLAWPIAIVNFVGTLFGFIYYIPQLSETPVAMWPIVPVSPLATLYIALSLALWRLGYSGTVTAIIHALAFFGCLKYGLWTVFVQLFVEDASALPFWLWQFLIWSHAGMAVQAFLIHRYAEFRLFAVAAATGWFTFNDVLDYFVSVGGGPHHTWLNVLWRDGVIDRTLAEFSHMAGGAVVLTVLATALAFGTRIAILEYGRENRPTS